jgi:1,4-alpha-glucan branching enzyme
MLASAGAAFAANPVTISLAVQGLAGAQTPRLIDDTLILSCKPAHSARFVGARFANEDWEVLHPYSRNENGVFVLDYAVPEGVREIRYRVEVDGLWMSDPTSARTETDAQGNRMSVFTLDREPPRTIANPKREPGGAVSFTFRGAPGKRVTIMGDFNGWDPFANPLAESEPGTYRIALRVRPGSHWYVFYSAGRRILDAYNTETGTDPDGSTVSYFSLFP